MTETRVLKPAFNRVWLELLEKWKILQSGHFEYKSGKHGSIYLWKNGLFRLPVELTAMLREAVIAIDREKKLKSVRDILKDIDVIIGPDSKGSVLGFALAHLLSTARSTYGYKPLGWVGVRRDFTIDQLDFGYLSGKKALLCDDVLNTGLTLHELADLCRRAGACVVGALVVYDRCQGEYAFTFPVWTLAQYAAPPNCDPGDCPQCRSGVPLTVL